MLIMAKYFIGNAEKANTFIFFVWKVTFDGIIYKKKKYFFSADFINENVALMFDHV